jgi:hypothetical protein
MKSPIRAAGDYAAPDPDLLDTTLSVHSGLVQHRQLFAAPGCDRHAFDGCQ